MTVNTAYASVRSADDADQQAVLDVLTEAFMSDPVAGWLFPELGERALLQPHFYRSLLTPPAGEAYLVGDREGASIWLAYAAGQASQEDSPEGANLVFGKSGARLLALGQALAQRHPTHEPHLYLACMGVIGARQGAGLGSALLRHGLDQADAAGIAAYLEASSPRSRALYKRYGFDDLGEPVRVEDSPLLWPMWRQPTPTGGEHR